ncbi:MAG: hypothetical protein HY721_30405 [Planctomycetes bacterium]|nr:hypothetical protein [Planctomycetota bacterium]
MRKLSGVVFAVFLSLAAGLPATARASFHFMRISEVLGQFRGDPRIQFVELQLAAAGHNFVGGHKVIFQDAAGTKTGEVTFPGKVDNGANGANILVGTAAFAAAFGVAVDLVLPEGVMAPLSGRVCFDTVDCVAYGAYTGPNPGHGAPAPGFSADGAKSLTLKVVTLPGPGDNSADYELRDPTPRNNKGETGTIPVACYFTDGFADMSHWDQPAEGAGLDLEPCLGAPVKPADIGFADVAGNALILTPGQSDDLSLGAPICITGLDNTTGKSIADKNYRVTLDLVAHQGIAIAAFFVRQRYSFDDAASALDVSQASGTGINFGFDNIGETTDHVHSDIRHACLQEGNPDPQCPDDEFDLPEGGIFQSETEYTLILDVDGDDASGPLTLQVKIFPAGEPEPPYAMGTFPSQSGIGAVEDEGLEHEILIAALGSSGATMEVTRFSICPTPRDQKYVRCLSCVRQEDGSVFLSWMNPSDAPADQQIQIAVNGSPVAQVAGDSVSHTILDPPDGDLTIAVTNYSGSPVTCSVCENGPPEVVIDGPARAELQGGTVTVALDSSASTDGDDGTQDISRFWELVSAPPEGNASLDDPGAVTVMINMNSDGEYKVRLTITDSGCPGSPPLAESREHTITVGAAPPGGKQKPGDENQDGKLDLSDPVSVLNHLFLGTNPSLPCGDGTAGHAANIKLLDGNGDGKIDLSDAIRVLSFLFLGALPPDACGGDPQCPCVVIADCPEVCR